MSNRRNCLIFHTSAGFTLTELLMTIVILGFLSLILIPFFQSISHSPDPVFRQRAVALGQALMDEILAKQWDNNTPVGGGPIPTNESSDTGAVDCTLGCTGGNRIDCFRCYHSGYSVTASTVTMGTETGEAARSSWNDVDDYNGLTEPVGTLFSDQNGAAFSMPGYTRTAAIRYIASNTGSIDNTTAASATTTDTKLIIVTVTSPLDESYYFTATACNF